MNSFIKKVKNFVFHQGLLEKGDRVLVGVSGGPDSICLSRVLLEMKKSYQLQLKLVHVNYGLRGEDSSEDEQFVRNFCENYALPLTVIHYQQDNSRQGNLEEQMRDFRYKKFNEIAKSEGFDKIALAHNLDDQVETFLMNLFRGAGTRGLAAMRSKRGKIIRPLLVFTKAEILQYLKALLQEFRQDLSNLDQSLLRNKIRLSLVPTLQEYSPRIKDRIFQLASNLQDEMEIVEQIVEKQYNDIVQSDKGQHRVLVTELLRLSVGTRKLLFRKIIEQIKGDLRDVSTNNFFEFNKIVESTKSKQQKCLIGEIEIYRKGEEIIFSK